MSDGKQTESDALKDEVVPVKFRLTGAAIWLGLLVIIVPIWYSNPVNFSPADSEESQSTEKVLVEQPFVLPLSDKQKQLLVQKASEEKEAANQERAEAVKVQPVQKKSNALAVLPEASDEVTKTKLPETKIEPASQPVSQVTEDVKDAGPWILRLVAYRKKDMADAMRDRLKYDYDAYIKHFPKSRYYSVRVGPYSSKQEALKDQKRLNRILRINSELVRFVP